MKTARFLIAAVALVVLMPTEADAQFGKRLLDRVAKKAEEAVTRKAEQAVDKAVDKATDPETYKGDGSDQQQGQTQQQQGNVPATAPAPTGVPADAGQQAPAAQAPQQSGQSALEMTYAKNDFVPGDEIIFSDEVVGEQLGEFPSQWDLISGTVEVANMNGANVVFFTETSRIAPLMKDMQNYLPDVFTIEFDYWKFPNSYTNRYQLELFDGRTNVLTLQFAGAGNPSTMSWRYRTPSGESRNGDGAVPVENMNAWNHLSVSFNQRALKVYVNGTRIANVPSMAAPKRLQIFGGHTQPAEQPAITNIRIAGGAVPLYDRMMSDGKFITYGITFDVGKSTIKPESMGEINRIVELMNQNPDLRFSVEGHTDSTGNAASNQTLSEARSQAIVAKLTELGIAADRLTSSGKGQNNPIADNSTDEGRAKNRRVEFVKL